jgi:two-component system nitrogen regulation response regulator GlnG
VRANVRVIAATHQNLEDRVKQGVFREDLFHRLNVIRLRLPALRERREDVPMLTRFFLQQSARQLGVEPKRISEAALRLLGTFDFPGNVRQLENVCHWLTVMAPAQMIEVKDLPPEVLSMAGSMAVTSAPVSAPVPTPAPVLQTTVALPESEGLSEPVAPLGEASSPRVGAAPGVSLAWETGLQAEALSLLEEGRTDVWDVLTRRFETRLIQTALANTRGRRIEAAHKLGIGRNTITRKIQELNLE